MFSSNPKAPEKGVVPALKSSLMAGLFIVVPILVTRWIGWWSISIMTDWSVQLLHHYRPEWEDKAVATVLIRVGTILFLAIAIFLVGLLGRATLGKQMIQLAHKFLMKLPLLSTVYSTCEQIGETVKTQQGGLFKQVVFFEYPRKGCWAIGFITNYNENDFELNQYFKNGMYSVFMPTTPNPTSGFLLYVPKEDCILLEMCAGDAMRLIVSGGVVLPGQKPSEEQDGQ